MEGELQRIRAQFVQRVSLPVIKGLLDELWQRKVLSTEGKDSVMEDQRARTDRARCLVDMVIGKGEAACWEMIDILKEVDPALCSTLGLISPPTARAENRGRKRGSSESEEVADKRRCSRDGSDRNNKNPSTGQNLSDKQLLQVAQRLGQEWERAAIHLDLSITDLDDIKAEIKSVPMQKLKMLVLWRRRRPLGKATAQHLLSSLKDLRDLPCEAHQLLKDMMKL